MALTHGFSMKEDIIMEKDRGISAYKAAMQLGCALMCISGALFILNQAAFFVLLKIMGVSEISSLFWVSGGFFFLSFFSGVLFTGTLLGELNNRSLELDLYGRPRKFSAAQSIFLFNGMGFFMFALYAQFWC